MHRELDPHLFEPKKTETSESSSGRSLKSSPQWSDNSVGFQQLEINELKQQLKIAKKQYEVLEEKVSRLTSQSSEAIKTHFHRLERLGKEFSQMEAFQKKLYEDFHSSVAQLNSKMNERKLNESKVEELLDRQNMVIRNFENRLASMQRLLSEKEGQLLHFKSVLQDAQREIERLRGRT